MSNIDFNQKASEIYLSEAYPDFWEHPYFNLTGFVAANTWDPLEDALNTIEVIDLIKETASLLEQVYKLGQESVTPNVG